MTLVNIKTREILGYDIAHDRSLQSIQSIQNLVDNAPKAELYFSDTFSGYSQICYEWVYCAINKKSKTKEVIHKHEIITKSEDNNKIILKN